MLVRKGRKFIRPSKSFTLVLGFLFGVIVWLFDSVVLGRDPDPILIPVIAVPMAALLFQSWAREHDRFIDLMNMQSYEEDWIRPSRSRRRSKEA